MRAFVNWRSCGIACGAAAGSIFGGVTAHGQTLRVDSRSGSNLAYCGAFSAPFVVRHDYVLAENVHDVISISDPGPPSNGGNARLDSDASSTGILISVAGGSFRGAPLGFVHAAAAGVDNWSFTVDQPTCFTFSVSMRAASTLSRDQAQGYSLVGPGLIPAPGTPPNTFSDGFFAPGAFERSGTGTLLPGAYSLSIGGRADASTFPYEATYDHSIALTIGPATLASGPTAASSCKSGAATFEAAAAGAGPFTYQWRVESPADSGVYIDLTPGTFFEPSSGLTFDAAGVMSPAMQVSNLDLAAHPDVIRFVVRVASACGGSTSAPAAWTICTGDLNCDDIVDFVDYLDFLSLFDAQDPTVDYNQDGVVDFSDYLEFLNHFDVGC